MALNTAISMIRRRGVFSLVSFGSEPEMPSEPDTDKPEEIALLYKAISQLKRVDKALVLLWLEEKSYSEIAQILGITEKNVSVKMVRIKKRLGELIRCFE